MKTSADCSASFNGSFGRGLVLKERQKTTKKWPINLGNLVYKSRVVKTFSLPPSFPKWGIQTFYLTIKPGLPKPRDLTLLSVSSDLTYDVCNYQSKMNKRRHMVGRFDFFSALGVIETLYVTKKKSGLLKTRILIDVCFLFHQN